ncbi:MAG: PAS domain S-box protein [Pseudomonadota bacterium]|nr:PAS domain S-box protein [Pseudomonadota bacterium]
MANLKLYTSAMRESQAFLKNIINHVADPIFVKDREHRWIEGNAALWNLFGKTEEELLGKSDYDFFPKEEADVFWAKDEEVFASGKENINVENFTDAHGVTHIISTKKACFKTPGGELILVGIIRDITELKKAQDALRQSDSARLKAIMDHAGRPVYFKDLEGRYLEVNNTLATILSLEEKDIIGKTDYELFSKENADLIRRNDLAVIEKNEALECEETLALPDGMHTYISVKFPLYDAADRMYAVYGISTDITERKHSEASKAFLASIIESSDDAIISITLDGIITSWNHAASMLFDYTAEEAVGQHVSLLIPPEKYKEEQYILGQARKGEPVRQLATVRQGRNGRLIDVALTVSPIRDCSGRIIGASKIVRDVSERKKIEQQLKAFIDENARAKRIAEDALAKAEMANQAKSDFLANMSHEIRTPMNAVVGIANILATVKEITAAKQQELVKTLQLSAQSMMALIDDLLDIAKIENAQVQLERKPFSLKKLAEEAITIMSVKAKEKGIALLLDYEEALSEKFTGDSTRIRQILMNLLSNAVKFTEAGSVTVKIFSCMGKAGGKAVCLQVTDTGIGIPEKKLGSIFDKFVQADNSITRQYGGTGLGLAITRMLAELMGGSIEVKSTVGQGTSFTVYLPCAVQPGSAAPREEPIPVHERREKKRLRILLVEDYQPNILVAATILRQMGYHCEVARNGQEAVEKLAHSSFDLALMDIRMPVMDGYMATQKIREREKAMSLPHLPIIGITAHALHEDRSKCLSAGMDDYMSKPFDPNDLNGRIQALAEKRRAA